MPFISREELYRLYITESNTMEQVAKLLGVAVGTVYNYMKKYEIPARPKMTTETRAKISKANKGKLLGRKREPMNDATKKKLSESKKGRYIHPSKFGGHRKRRADGYIAVYCPRHERATRDGYVMEHILVMEAQIGRALTADEVVHHKNKNRADNRVENLEVMTFSEHARLHMRERWENRKE